MLKECLISGALGLTRSLFLMQRWHEDNAIVCLLITLTSSHHFLMCQHAVRGCAGWFAHVVLLTFRATMWDGHPCLHFMWPNNKRPCDPRGQGPTNPVKNQRCKTWVSPVLPMGRPSFRRTPWKFWFTKLRRTEDLLHLQIIWLCLFFIQSSGIHLNLKSAGTQSACFQALCSFWTASQFHFDQNQTQKSLPGGQYKHRPNSSPRCEGWGSRMSINESYLHRPDASLCVCRTKEKVEKLKF